MHTHECTEDRFLKDVSKHIMTVELDQGVHRCLKFSAPGTWCMGYRLTTYPGGLCFSGDMGTFVFERLEDMFQFFRQKPYKDEKVPINVGYWMEKCEAQDTRGSGMREFDPIRLEENCRDCWRDHFLEKEEIDEDGAEPTSEEALECWGAIKNEVLSTDPNEVRVYDALSEFEHGEFRFHDAWEWGLTRPTFRMIWCLYAISWGIQQYDAAQATA